MSQTEFDRFRRCISHVKSNRINAARATWNSLSQNMRDGLFAMVTAVDLGQLHILPTRAWFTSPYGDFNLCTAELPYYAEDITIIGLVETVLTVIS